MKLDLKLGIDDPAPGCDNPGSCVLDNLDHDGPCAISCGECDGAGCKRCHDGLLWTVA